MKVLFIFGTRPEAIKCAPLIKQFLKVKSLFETKVCVTAQHRQLLDQVLDFFEIVPDYDLNIMKNGQSLFDITTVVFKGIESLLNNDRPDLIFVQGDTTTVLVAAISGFYKKIKVAHLEGYYCGYIIEDGKDCPNINLDRKVSSEYGLVYGCKKIIIQKNVFGTGG